ncbi:hypothetical protein CHARACLAT_011079 [Characodon lateralis]|uniref:Uncharacterized protein n=1 Tax=Characodon lateralis TaxID=208331 RepID=A0ABU7DZL2_9TELE|nr:hypothetical protein [Characodon lateralis]
MENGKNMVQLHSHQDMVIHLNPKLTVRARRTLFIEAAKRYTGNTGEVLDIYISGGENDKFAPLALCHKSFVFWCPNMQKKVQYLLLNVLCSNETKSLLFGQRANPMSGRKLALHCILNTPSPI